EFAKIPPTGALDDRASLTHSRHTSFKGVVPGPACPRLRRSFEPLARSGAAPDRIALDDTTLGKRNSLEDMSRQCQRAFWRILCSICEEENPGMSGMTCTCPPAFSTSVLPTTVAGV